MNLPETSAAGNCDILIIAIGNTERGDDAFGPLVVKALASRLGEDIAVKSIGGDIFSLIDVWSGYQQVILVDAAEPLDSSGQVQCVTISDLVQEESSTSIHTFGVRQIMDLAKRLGSVPEIAAIYTVGARDFGIGQKPSAAVLAAIDDTAERIAKQIDCLRHAPTRI